MITYFAFKTIYQGWRKFFKLGRDYLFMKKVFSIILYIIAALLLIIGIYMAGLYLAINFLIGQSNMGQVLDSMKSQLPLLPLGNYSLIITGILFIIAGIIIILVIRKLRR